MRDRSRVWEASLVAGGLLLAGFTLRTYRSFDGPSANPHQNRLTLREADSVILSAKSYLNSNPEDFNAWSGLAIAYFYKGPDTYPDGLNALDKARSLGANSESLFYYAGLMYEALGLPDYAANELSKYRRHHPEDIETQMHLANVYAQQKRFDDAYQLYLALSRKVSQDSTLWFNFGMVSKEKGDLDGAMSCFSKAETLSGSLPEGGQYQKGEIARLKGAHDQAVMFYQKELAIHPEFLPALKALEAEQKSHGLLKEARATRARIVAIKPR